MKRPISLHWFLSLNLGLALVVQCVVVAVLAWYILLPRMRTDIGFHQHALAHAVAGDVSTHVLGGERQLRALAEFIVTHPDLPETPMGDLLDAQCGDGDMFEAIYIIDLRNQTIQATGLAYGLRAKRRELTGLGFSEAGIFPQKRRSQEMTFWSDPFTFTVSGRVAVAVTIALGKQAITGVIAIDRLSEAVRNLSAGSAVQILILDRAGIIIADSKEIWQGRPFDVQRFREAHDLHAAPGIPTAFNLYGRPLVGTLTAIDPIGWKVVVAQHSRAAYQSIRSTFLTIVLGLLIAVLLALTLAWFQSSRLVRLFNAFYAHARAISQGQYDVQRPEARTKEFSQLVESLQQMAQMIRQREQRIVDSERRYKDLFNEAPVIYVITENRNTVPYVREVNNLFLDTLGYERGEVAGTPLVNYYTEVSRREVLENGGYQRALRGERLAEERGLVTRDGREIHTLLHTRPEYDPSGQVIGTRAMYLDITRRKRAEQESDRLAKALLQAQKMEAIGTLAGGIAHDFNNILSAVIGYADLSLKGVEKQTRLHENLEQILVAGLRARDLVQQILAFSRQEERELRPLQVAPLVEEALKLLRSSFPSTIEIRQQITSNLDNVLADPTQIHRIIINLCTNAAHAMEENGGVLTVALFQVTLTDQDVRLHPGLRPATYLKLSVQDTGRGIPPEILTKIFDPYFTTKSKGKGTGLGLSVVHGIVNNYGGAIFAYSEPGAGTIFNAYIPAVKRVPRPSESEAPQLPTGNEHILLVDDEPVIIEVGQMMLEMLGYKVTACDTGSSALALFQKDPQAIDLVISDVTMPKMTGERLAGEMLRLRPDLPIILCTGFSDKVGSRATAESGVKAVIMKPFIQKDLALLVRRVLDEARAER